jgi:hypothetical protein
MGYVGGDNTNHNTKLAILEDLKRNFLSIFILGKEGGVLVMQNLKIICEEGGVSDDAIFENLWCIDLLGNNHVAISMEFICQSISQKEMTNLN